MLPTIEGEPAYETINGITQVLYANAVNLMMPQGGVHQRHIGIIKNPTLYTTLFTMVWANPPNRGLYPKVPTNANINHQEQQ